MGGVKRNGGTHLRRKFIAVLPSFFILPLVEEEKRGAGPLACRRWRAGERASVVRSLLACLCGMGMGGVGWVGGWVWRRRKGICPGILVWRRRYGKEGGHGGLVG